MKRNKLKLIKVAILFVFFTNVCQTSYGLSKGILEGVILDKSTGSMLPEATILIAGTNNGPITNIYGKYTLTNIPAGKNTIVISFVSYETDSLVVNIVDGETKFVNVQLDVENPGLDEVIITAQLLGQKKAINQQLNADALVNVVSSDKIRELPDVNTVEAISSISGVSVQRSGRESNEIFLRGLSPDLTSITIDGEKLPAISGGNRSVDLSIISPELLSSIEVYKSPTADMDGDAIGGSISLGLYKFRRCTDNKKNLIESNQNISLKL